MACALLVVGLIESRFHAARSVTTPIALVRHWPDEESSTITQQLLWQTMDIIGIINPRLC